MGEEAPWLISRPHPFGGHHRLAKASRRARFGKAAVDAQRHQLLLPQRGGLGGLADMEGLLPILSCPRTAQPFLVNFTK